MRKPALAVILAGCLFSLLQVGCGGAGQNPFSIGGGATGSGSVAVFGGDAPLCSVLSLSTSVTGVSLIPQGGGTAVSVLSSGDATTVDFAALVGFNSFLNLGTAAAGTYSQVQLTLSSPTITYYDSTTNPPTHTLTGTFDPNATSTTQVTLNINPALVVSSNGAVGLVLDLHLPQSLDVDATGQITGAINPVFTASPSTITKAAGLGEIDDLNGTVQSVSTTSTNSSFVGSFMLQRAGGRTFQVNVTSNTVFTGAISSFSALTANAYVEIYGYVDSSGNIVATYVEIEDTLDGTVNHAVFTGVVTDVHRNAGNPYPDTFTLFIRREFPDTVTGSAPPRTPLPVNVDVAVATRIIRWARALNEANLAFDTTTLGPGQHVTVAGQFNSATPVSLNARLIVLRPRGYACDAPTGIVAANDGLTGGFTMTPCSPVIRGIPVYTLTFADTLFGGGLTNLNSLSGISASQRIVVRGLLFYEQDLTNFPINGIAPPTAPVYALEAAAVSEAN
jgi:Domain of unknown function (DUF4382)/Domain of unknown function (DUF5666)